MLLYNSSEGFVPAKQYGNTIHSDSLDIKKTERDALLCHYYVTIISSHLQAKSLFSSDPSQCTIIDPYISKTLWFIYINAVFAPHIDCVQSYSKHLYENKGRISHVCYVSR